jgi:vacuolar protein sorting-associated protein 35
MHYLHTLLFSVPFNNNVGRELIKLLKLPVENYTTCLAIFELNAYSNVLNLLNYRGKTQVCTFFIQRIIETNSYITSEDDVEKVRRCLLFVHN